MTMRLSLRCPAGVDLGRPPRDRDRMGTRRLIVAAGAASIWLSGNRGGAGSETVPRLQNAIQLTSALSVESYPTWSPDGQRLAYQANDAGFHSLVNPTSGWLSSGAASR